MRIVREGVLDTDLLEMIAHNTREYENRVNDMKAQIATNDRGVRLMTELIEMSGLENVMLSVEDIIEYTERRLRKIIAELPKGRFRRSEEHTSELQSLMRNSDAVLCLKKNKD